MRMLESAFSEESCLLAQREQTARDFLVSAESHPKHRARLQIDFINDHCAEDGWDDAETRRIEGTTIQLAYLFLDLLPDYCDVPDISPEPDGHIELEWYVQPRRTLSVSISPQGKIYWAALYGTEDPRGSCPFPSESLPETVLYWIGKITRA